MSLRKNVKILCLSFFLILFITASGCEVLKLGGTTDNRKGQIIINVKTPNSEKVNLRSYIFPQVSASNIQKVKVSIKGVDIDVPVEDTVDVTGGQATLTLDVLEGTNRIIILKGLDSGGNEVATIKGGGDVIADTTTEAKVNRGTTPLGEILESLFGSGEHEILTGIRREVIYGVTDDIIGADPINHRPLGNDYTVDPQSLDISRIVDAIISLVQGGLRPEEIKSSDIFALQDLIPPLTTPSPPGGFYTSIQNVALAANETAIIYYTIDGSDPNPSSTQYTSPISITPSATTPSTTLKFFGVDSAGNAETINTEFYVVSLPPDTQAPGDITNFTVTEGINNGEIMGSWINPPATDFAGVRFRYRIDGAFPNSIDDGTLLDDKNGLPGTMDSTIWIGLDPERTYHIKGFAHDGGPNFSPGVEANTFIKPRDLTPPGDVMNLTATPIGTQISLSWTNPTDSDFSGVKILRKIGGFPTSPTDGTDISDSTGTSFTDTGLTSGTTYFYTAYAHDEAPNYAAGAQASVTTEAWNKKFSSSGSNSDEARSVAIASDGSVYVVGYGTNLVGSSSGDWWIKKFDSAGAEDTVDWDKMIDGADGDDQAWSVALDPSDGSVYVVGYGTNLVGSSGQDWWIKKFDSAGVEDTTNWNNKTFDGSGSDDAARSVALDPSDGSVYVVGSGSNLETGSSGRDWWIKKFDSAGVEDTTNWNNKTFDDGGLNDDEAFSVAIASDGSVYVVGFGGSGGDDLWIKKFNSAGVEDTTNSWNQTFDGGSSSTDQAYSVAVDPSDGSVYMVGWGTNLVVPGTSGGDLWIKKFSSTGVEDTAFWNKMFDGAGGDDQAWSVTIDPSDSSVYVVGNGPNLLTGSSGNDWWIKKFSSSGVEDTTNWNKTIDNSSLADASWSVALDPSDSSVYIVGVSTNIVTGSSGFDWWIKKFDPDGVER